MSDLVCKLEQLQLTTVSQELNRILAEAAAKNLSHGQALEWLADVELEGRRARSIERRFRLSKLQAKLGIDSFDFNHHKSRMQIKTKLLRLLDLDFPEPARRFWPRSSGGGFVSRTRESCSRRP
jgi:hypothetical protein